ETGNGVARDRRAHEVEATFEFRAHADAIAAKLPQAFAFNSFAPLELNLQQLEGEKKAARLKAWKAEEVALAPAARYLVNGAPLGPEEARRLSRIVERHVRVKDAREAMRRGAGEVGPRRPAAEEGKPAERGPKLKEQARVACPLSAPEAPVAAAPSSHADLGAQGFDIDY
ncbi:MAG TPA: hypothetical protein VGV38_20990, partial [Pyrinomonadaceae bacterium]|nr:hypothetical protein [Pyrinomonadaceae bacterium]